MPSGNRRLPRTARSPIATGLSFLPSSDITSNRYNYPAYGQSLPTLSSMEPPVAPKHFPFPNISVESDLLFECVMFMFTTIASGLQFLHLYKSVWWLPHSYTNQALNFYLIDKNLVLFIIILLSRKVVYILGCKIMEVFLPAKFQELGSMIYRFFLFGVMFSTLSWCSFYVIQNNPIVNIFYLCYPILVYIILFGLKISPFFETINWNSLSSPPLHACTSKATEIRVEVENLKVNFNNRMKQILFCSILNAYYAAFIPCCFAQNFVYYCAYWATQHVLFVFLACFAAYTCHQLPPRYCDILHRATLHLGAWSRLDTNTPQSSRAAAVTAAGLVLQNTGIGGTTTCTPGGGALPWRADTLFGGGALVRYGRDVYRAKGESNAAEPGHAAFARFYAIFKNPASALGGLLTLHLFIVLFQLIILIRSTYWYHMISIAFILFFNYYILFKLGRDYFVSLKIYKAEQALHEKIPMQKM